jgi:hypothetical protein
MIGLFIKCVGVIIEESKLDRRHVVCKHYILDPDLLVSFSADRQQTVNVPLCEVTI